MTSYWLSDFCSLTNSMNINPFADGDKNFQFNSLTRLIIVITIASVIFSKQNKDEIMIGGVISIFLSIIIYMLTYNTGKTSVEFNLKDNNVKNSNVPNKPNKSLKLLLKDVDTNRKNSITLDYSKKDTQKMVKKLFLEKDDSPASVEKTNIDTADILSGSKSTPVNTVKQSLIGKILFN